MEERIEREQKVWNEHTDLRLAGERAKFEEEKIRLLKDAQDQLKLEQERCQNLEKKLYNAQMVCYMNLLKYFCSRIHLKAVIRRSFTFFFHKLLYKNICINKKSGTILFFLNVQFT